MTIGPIQIVVVAFDTIDRFRGEILTELYSLRKKGVIRLVDFLFVARDEDGEIVSLEDSDLSPEEALKFGSVIGGMLGFGAGGEEGALEESVAGVLAVAENDFGLKLADVQEVAEQIQPGTAGAILLIEHKWAARLKEATQNAGGRTLAQGFLTPEALIMVGAEVQAMVEAQETIALAEAVKGAAMLDALAAVAEAKMIEEIAVDEAAEAMAAAAAIKMAAAADVVRTLTVAGLLEEAAIQDVIETLTRAQLIEQAAIDEANQVVAAAEARIEAAQSSSGPALPDQPDLSESSAEMA